MSWPAGVNENTPLPYAVWQVLDTLAHHSPADTAKMLNLTPEQVQQAVAFASEMGQRQERQEQVLNRQLIHDVSQALMAVVGPIGSIMVDDSLDELPQNPRMGQLLRQLSTELADNQRQAFFRQLQTKGLL